MKIYRILPALLIVISCATEYGEPRGTVFEIDPSATTGEMIPNVVSDLNVFTMAKKFVDPQMPEENNIFQFVDYVQLMSATGGSFSRDLFRNPEDFSIRDDYDFSNLIGNCRGILKLGAKPCIKTGSVPVKLCKEKELSYYNVAKGIPADYDEYYRYIRAIAEALVAEFGKEEAASWHYGVYTEYENGNWFKPEGLTPEETAQEFCKIYDTTAKALTDVLGPAIFIGAHSMTNMEGYWDEAIFIRHCAESGVPIKYLAASYYAGTPWNKPLISLGECLAYLKNTAENCGLKDLKYGIDEGRIVSGHPGKEASDLLSRTVGYSYMGAFDVRLFKELLDAGGSYFSSWGYLSENYTIGLPSISYHVATKMYEMCGADRLAISDDCRTERNGSESGLLAGRKGDVLKIAAYNFKNDLDYADSLDMILTVKQPAGRKVHTVSITNIDDDCNWFDEWTCIRKENNITDDMFNWSSDDACNLPANLNDSTAEKIFNENIPLFRECAKMHTTRRKCRTGKDGYLLIRLPMKGNTAVFVDIK